MRPGSAVRPQWWANEVSPDSRQGQSRVWRNAGYDGFFVPDASACASGAESSERVMTRETDTIWRLFDGDGGTDCRSRTALERLAKRLGRASADACHRLGIAFDIVHLIRIKGSVIVERTKGRYRLGATKRAPISSP